MRSISSLTIFATTVGAAIVFELGSKHRAVCYALVTPNFSKARSAMITTLPKTKTLLFSSSLDEDTDRDSSIKQPSAETSSLSPSTGRDDGETSFSRDEPKETASNIQPTAAPQVERSITSSPPPAPQLQRSFSSQELMAAMGTNPRRIAISLLSASGIALAGNLFGCTSRILTAFPEVSCCYWAVRLV